MTVGHPGTGPAEGLRAFRTTAEVPRVGGPAVHVDGAGAFEATSVRIPAPLGLRLAVWTTAVLLAAGLAGLALHRLRPSALGALEVGRSVPTTVARASVGKHPVSPSHGPAAPVSQTHVSATGAAWTVDAAQYTVVVSARAPCWLEVTAPGSSAAVFTGTLSAGGEKSLAAVNGQLKLLIGASQVTVSVVLEGKSTPVWSFVPTTAPYTLSFTSDSG